MPSITGSFAHNIYYSRPNKLEDLCNGHIDNSAFKQFVELAASGEQASIEFLYNIALQNSELGKKAENALFDIFSLKTSGKVDVDKQIQQMGLQLYETFANNRNSSNAINMLDKFGTQSKLAYIAGSAIENTSEKQRLSNSLFGEPDIWGENRMIDSYELYSGMKSVLKKPEGFSLNYPIELALLDTKINQKEALASRTECFVVNTGYHWVLFALYKQDNEKKAIVFNSWNNLEKGACQALENVAAHVGAGSIQYLENNLQEHVPNGCSLFVIKAIEKISESPEQDTVKVLEEMADVFLNHSIEEQEKFNIAARRQLYAIHTEE